MSSMPKWLCQFAIHSPFISNWWIVHHTLKYNYMCFISSQGSKGNRSWNYSSKIPVIVQDGLNNHTWNDMRQCANMSNNIALINMIDCLQYQFVITRLNFMVVSKYDRLIICMIDKQRCAFFEARHLGTWVIPYRIPFDVVEWKFCM